MEEIQNMLLKLGFEKLKEIVSNLNGYNGCLDYLDYQENDSDFFETYFSTIDDAIRAVCYGEYTYTDPYVIINAYGNCDTVGEYEYQSLLEENIADIVDNFIELWDEVDDWLKDELPEELVNMINQYKENSGESEV